MKKTVLKVLFASLFVFGVLFNINIEKRSTDQNSSLLRINAEALADREDYAGSWVVVIYSPTSWTCYANGGICCPDWDC